MIPWLSKQQTDPKNLEEFDKHSLVSFAYDEATGLSSLIAVHRTNNGIPSFGATRLWHYQSAEEGIRDALRLSRLMSYKAALAGLPCGGAKGVVFDRPEYHQDHELRTAALQKYALRASLLGHNFVTGMDMGITQEDLHAMNAHDPQVIGFNDNATEFTGLGIFESIRVSLQEAFGSPDPSGRSFAIQGLGKIGTALLAHLVPAVGTGTIYVSDVDNERVETIRALYPSVQPVSPDAIHLQDADVFSPCAVGGTLNQKTANELRAKVIAGGANNQLAKEQVGDTLFARGITYAPDYVANAGGIIAIYDEYENPKNYQYDVVREKVEHIPQTLTSIFAESHAQHRAPHRVANEMAERIFNAYA